MGTSKLKTWQRWSIVAAVWISCVPALWFWAFFELMVIFGVLDHAFGEWSLENALVGAGWLLFAFASATGWVMLVKLTWSWAKAGLVDRRGAKRALILAALGMVGLNYLAPFGLLASPAFVYLAAMAGGEKSKKTVSVA
jgi:hypothetical protein